MDYMFLYGMIAIFIGAIIAYFIINAIHTKKGKMMILNINKRISSKR